MKNIKNINYILLILLVLVLIYILLKCRRKNMEKFTTVTEAEANKVAAEAALGTAYSELNTSITALPDMSNLEITGNLKDIVDKFHEVYNNLNTILGITEETIKVKMIANIQSKIPLYDELVAGNVILPNSDFTVETLNQITKPTGTAATVKELDAFFTNNAVEETAYNDINKDNFTPEEIAILVNYNALFTEISGGGVEIATDANFTTLKNEMDTEAEAAEDASVVVDDRKTEYINALQSIFFNYSVDKNKITELKTEIEDNFAVTGIPVSSEYTITNDISGLDNNVFGDLINLYNNFNTSLTEYNNSDTALILATEAAEAAERQDVITDLTKEEKDQIFEGSSRRIDLPSGNQTFHTNTSNLDNIDKHILWMNYTDAHEFDIDVRNFDDIDYGESDFNNQSTKIGYFKQVLSNSSTSIDNKVILHPGNLNFSDVIEKGNGEEFIFGLESDGTTPNLELELTNNNYLDYFKKSHIFVGSIVLEFDGEYANAKTDLEEKFLLLSMKGKQGTTNTPLNISTVNQTNEANVKAIPLNSQDIKIKQRDITIGSETKTKVGIFFKKNLPFDMETLIQKGEIENQWKGVKISISDSDAEDNYDVVSTLEDISNIYVNFVFFKANKADKMTEMYNLINANYKILQYKTQILVNYFRCKDQKKTLNQCDLMDVGFKTSDIDSRLWGALKAIPPPPPKDIGEDSGITSIEEIVDKKDLIIKLLARLNAQDDKTFNDDDLLSEVVGTGADKELSVDDVYRLLGMRNPN